MVLHCYHINSTRTLWLFHKTLCSRICLVFFNSFTIVISTHCNAVKVSQWPYTFKHHSLTECLIFQPIQIFSVGIQYTLRITVYDILVYIVANRQRVFITQVDSCCMQIDWKLSIITLVGISLVRLPQAHRFLHDQLCLHQANQIRIFFLQSIY